MKQDRIVLERLMSHRISEQLAEIDSVYFARLYEAIGGRIYKKSAQSLKRLSSNGSWDVFQQPNIIIVPDSSFPLGIDITTGEVSIEATYSGLDNVNSLGFIMHEIDVIDHFRRTLKIFNEYRDSKYRCVSQVYAKLMDILVLENGDLGSAKLKLYEYMYKKGHKVAVRDQGTINEQLYYSFTDDDFYFINPDDWTVYCNFGDDKMHPYCRLDELLIEYEIVDIYLDLIAGLSNQIKINGLFESNI